MSIHRNGRVDTYQWVTSQLGPPTNTIVRVARGLMIVLVMGTVWMACCGCSASRNSQSVADEDRTAPESQEDSSELRLLMDGATVIHNSTHLSFDDTAKRMQIELIPFHSSGLVYVGLEFFEDITLCKRVTASGVPYEPILHVFFEEGEDEISEIVGFDDDCTPTEEEKQQFHIRFYEDVLAKQCDVGRDYAIRGYAWPADVDVNSDIPLARQAEGLSRRRSEKTQTRIENGYFSPVVDAEWYGVSRTNFDGGFFHNRSNGDVLGAVVVPTNSAGIHSEIGLAPQVGDERVRKLLELSEHFPNEMMSTRSFRLRVHLEQELANRFSMDVLKDVYTRFDDEYTNEFSQWVLA